MLSFKEVIHATNIQPNQECILVGDIGGTNSNFGIFAISKQGIHFLLSLHIKSKEIEDFTSIVTEVIAYLQETYLLSISTACFAAAGVVLPNRTYCKPTNLHFAINAQQIKERTHLQCVVIVNDFEVIGHGIGQLKAGDVRTVNTGQAHEFAPRAIIGAGTGLGKCILIWHQECNQYVPLPSEGGHADFCPQNAFELELVNYIKQSANLSCNVSWEDILSGKGIQRIYRFLKKEKSSSITNYELEGDHQDMHPDVIFANRTTDKISQRTYELYSIFYARCAKNFALEALALGGVYIAGGIAAHNVDMFSQLPFLSEFVNCGKHMELLKQIPLHIITDYDVSLYGAAQYVIQEKLCMLE